MRRVIGLTGGIASGKSTVSERLKEQGCHIADADAVSRTLLEPGGKAYMQVIKTFPGYTGKDGRIDRAGLGAYVFSHRPALEKLNAITHPIIVSEISEDIKNRDGIVIIDAPLLIETGLHRLCGSVWLVVADRELRIKRAAARSGLSYEEAKNRIDSQLSDEEKRAYADKVIENSGSVKELYDKVDMLLREEMNGIS